MKMCYYEPTSLCVGWLEPAANKYVVIPYTDTPGVQHKYAITLYTDNEHKFEKINPRACLVDCVQVLHSVHAR